MHISLGRKKQSEGHIKRFEDALTSVFFGTLRYLPPRIVIEFFISLLGTKQALLKEGLAKLCSDDTNIKMEFWPNCADEGRVEPDLKITLSSSSYLPIDLLIECKWKSGESSDCQLLGQWSALKPSDRLKTYHVYLVKDLQQANIDREQNIEKASVQFGEKDTQEWGDRLFAISWFEVLKATFSLTDPDRYHQKVVTQWGKDMEEMFERIGIREFKGFSHLSKQIAVSEGRLFWDCPFHGFQRFVDVNIIPTRSVVFYS